MKVVDIRETVKEMMNKPKEEAVAAAVDALMNEFEFTAEKDRESLTTKVSECWQWQNEIKETQWSQTK